MKSVCCFGELLLRYAPDRNWLKNAAMPLYIGGAELNVATALANWDLPVKYVTSLPDNYLADDIINELNERKIDTSGIRFEGNRIGGYFLPIGSELKSKGVLYDREHSSFSQLQPGQVDWRNILEGCDWFHFSAISPALNSNIVSICKEAVLAAANMGLTISLDLNYRNKLWNYGADPVGIMPELVQHCDVVMGNLWATESLLGITSEISNSNGKLKKDLLEAAATSMRALQRNYPRVKTVAYTYRLNNSYWAMLMENDKVEASPEFATIDLVDRVGTGDCFMAGLIYGLKNKIGSKATIDFAAASAVGKLSEPGDSSRQSIKQIYNRIPVE